MTPNPSRGRRALALVSGITLATSVLAAAGLSGGGSAASAAELAETTFTDGNYVVLLTDTPAAAYEGGTGDYARTRPSQGRAYGTGQNAEARYESFLEAKQDRLLAAVGATPNYHYTVAVNGFAAPLTARQAARLAQTRGVLAVNRDEARSLETVSSPEFLGLPGAGGTWAGLGSPDGRTAGAGVVVGVIDSGIWPESASFAGAPLGNNASTTTPWITAQSAAGPVTSFVKSDASTFTGLCERGNKWQGNECNTKLVSARYFEDGFVANVAKADRGETEFLSPRDGDGHGTHTASTAAGNAGVPVTIDGASYGTASGMAPAAKVAAYKVCWEDIDPATGGCYTSDSVAAINQAVKDGVDVLNYSISGATTTVVDAVEFAFFNAAAAGIFVAASAGNSGPTASTVAHNSPWLTTVAASTHNRAENTVVLGNGARYKGASISKTPLPSSPVVLASSIGAAGATPANVAVCAPGSLSSATGKIVVCDRGVISRVEKSAEVKRVGGVGMILANISASSLDSDVHTIPTIHVDNVAGSAIKSYVSGTTAPTASFVLGDTTGGAPTPVPQIAGFSSRGPALSSGSDLLKPDISAPGVSVIAAVAPPAHNGRSFDVLSGTSMSSPHIAGLAALFFQQHPTWTPMMVKSAMMTTAYDLKGPSGAPATDPFAQGAGHVDPSRFFNPGLLVTSTPREWAGFYAGQGLQLGAAGAPFTPIAASDLNVPSIAVGQLAGTRTITRTFTAEAPGTWSVSVAVPGFSSDGTPSSLAFGQRGESLALPITLTRTDATLSEFAKGFVTLTKGAQTVRLPVAVRPVAVAAPAEVAGSNGSATATVTAGFTGELTVSQVGLAPGARTAGSIGSGADNAATSDVVVPAGTVLARFDLDAANDAAGDFDLYVYRVNVTTGALTLVGQSASGAADERVDLRDPAAATYRAVAENFATAPGETTSAYALTTYVVNPATAVGGLTVTPNPVPVVQGREASFTASWSGLTAGTSYLGVLRYEGTNASTVLTVRG